MQKCNNFATEYKSLNKKLKENNINNNINNHNNETKLNNLELLSSLSKPYQSKEDNRESYLILEL